MEYPDFHFSAFDAASEAMWEKSLTAQATAPVDSFYFKSGSSSRESTRTSAAPTATAPQAIEGHLFL